MSHPPSPSLWKSLRRRLASGRGEGLVWAGGFAVLALLSLLLYAVVGRPMQPWPGSLPGLIFGTAAAVLFLASALYGVRRRIMGLASRWRLGRTRSWLYLHLYGGLFFLLLVSLHSAFRWPSGLASWVLWILSWWTVLTGLGGLALQRWIPRVLASLSVEINAARIPQMVTEIQQRAEALVAACGDPVRKLAARRITPGLAAPRRSWSFFIDPSGGSSKFPMEELAYLRDLSRGEEEERLGQLQELLAVKHELDVHFTLQRALRLWLVVHLPASLLLLAAIVIHILSVLYY